VPLLELRDRFAPPHRPGTSVNPTLALLLSGLYDGALAPEHREDLARSGLTDETLRAHYIR
jgi:hypothetical protein